MRITDAIIQLKAIKSAHGDLELFLDPTTVDYTPALRNEPLLEDLEIEGVVKIYDEGELCNKKVVLWSGGTWGTKYKLINSK